MIKPLEDIFRRADIPSRPPIWLMRQAGRYLPEYRKCRAQAGDFLSLCYNSDLASVVTLQPVERFDFDAAIIFADILLLCDALGQELWFVEGEGPRLTPIQRCDDLVIDNIETHLAPVGETIMRVRKALSPDKTVIGFAGAPWTVASYMIAGCSTQYQGQALALMRSDRVAFQGIIDILIEATIRYLVLQVQAGAEVLQLFESWGGSLRGNEFTDFAIAPATSIITGLRARGVTVPIIGFPRGVNHDFYIDYAMSTGLDGLGLGSDIDIVSISKCVAGDIVIQGNLPPETLRVGGDMLITAAEDICSALESRRFIFNLGHGILPDTPLENVQLLVDYIHSR